MESLARSSRWLFLLCLVCICATARGQQQNSVPVAITGLIIQGELPQVKFSIPFRLVPAPAYQYSITGNVHGAGPLYSTLVPTSEPVATAFEAIHQGLSSALEGSFSNPGSQLPGATFNEQVTSGTDGAFNATFTIAIDDAGSVTFSVTNVAITNSFGQPDTTDNLVFDSGDVTITALSADVFVATLSATNVSTESATLQSSVICPNPFQAWFVYGTGTSSFSGTSSVVSLASSGTAQNISIPVTGLLPHQTYYFKAVGQDVTGPAYGDAQRFKTADIPPVAGTVTAFAGLAPLPIPVLDSASDSDGAVLKVTAVSNGAAGRAAIIKGGSAVTYRFTAANVLHDHFSYTVSDGFGGSATGQVNVINYAILKGTYSAVLLDPASQNAGGGLLRLSVSATGHCTGSVTIAGVTYPFSGAFDSSGQFSTTLASPVAPNGVVVTLDMVQSGSGYVVNAGVAMNGLSLVASLPHAVAGPGGAYTLLLPPPPGASYAGSGYALVQITSIGLASIAGALPDGAPFSCQAVVDAAGQAGIFSLLYAPPNRGRLAGTLTIGGVGYPLISGTLIWTKPALASAGIDQGPFSIALTGSGGLYIPPVHAAALQSGNPANAALVTLSAGNLNSPIRHAISIAPNNQVSILVPGLDRLSLSIQPATGLFTGRFIDPLNGVTRLIHGALLQHSATGGGYFLGDSQSGSVDIGP